MDSKASVGSGTESAVGRFCAFGVGGAAGRVVEEAAGIKVERVRVEGGVTVVCPGLGRDDGSGDEVVAAHGGSLGGHDTRKRAGDSSVEAEGFVDGGIHQRQGFEVSVLEAFGLFQVSAAHVGRNGEKPPYALMQRIRAACDRGIAFIQQHQEVNGAWKGRWGVNLIYGTSNVLCGLAYFLNPDDESSKGHIVDDTDQPTRPTVYAMAKRGVDFLLSVQNQDGGWAESLATYNYTDITAANSQQIHKHFSTVPSTASQTAWASMALATYLQASHEAVTDGVRYLVQHQTETSLISARKYEIGSDENRPTASDQSEAAMLTGTTLAKTWPGEAYTGTGFPNHFYLGYTLYSHYFPMMALGRFLQAKRDERAGTAWSM